MATDKERFAELLDKQDFQMITSFKQTYIDALKHYYFVGGMPEAVQSFVDNKDFNEVREIQKRILAAYEQDFSKHAPNEIVPQKLEPEQSVYLRIAYNFTNDSAVFYYSLDGENWSELGNPQRLSFSIDTTFMGTRSWLFCYATKEAGGYADFDYYLIYDAL